MTAENQGTGASDGDDPFAYLYRQEGGGAEDPAATAPQPGVPRTSYNQVRAVGERQYGGGRQQYGGSPTGTQTAAYGSYQEPYGQASPSAHYAAPETMPGGRAATRRQGPGGPEAPTGPGRGRGGGGNRNGLLIGAVAVVAAVVIGIGSAMLFNNEDPADTGGTQAGSTPTADAGGGGGQQDSGKQQDDAGKKKDEKAGLPKEDAAALRLGGTAQVQSTVPGAKGRNGTYVTGMNAVGSGATWDTKVKKAGSYNLYVRYSVPGADMGMSLDVNGKPHATGLNMKNFANAAEGDWAKGWTYTYATVHLDKGQNTFTISCKQGDTCNALLDQVWLAPPGEE